MTSPQVQFFVIRHIPTGFFLPLVKFSLSHATPMAMAIPRLFAKRANAEKALVSYCEGKWIKEKGEGYLRNAHMAARLVPNTSRNRLDFEILPVHLTIEGTPPNGSP